MNIYDCIKNKQFNIKNQLTKGYIAVLLTYLWVEKSGAKI